MRKFLSIVIAISMMLFLSSCAQPPPRTDTTLDLDIPVLSVEHGEDYVIEWADEGMEAHIRMWLGKPEGDIYHSDVWDIRLVNISPGGGADYDVIMEMPPENRNYFDNMDFCYEESRMYYDASGLPAINSLEDLRHFDSLQYLLIASHGIYTYALTDISALTACKNLKVLKFVSVYLESLDEIGQLTSLERLNLLQCFSEGELDLEPLRNLTNVWYCAISNTGIMSLEPLVDLPLQLLNIGCGLYTKNLHDNLDFEPISRMEKLTHLNFSRVDSFTKEDCEFIMSSLENLKQIDISYTMAADYLGDIRAQYPKVRFICDGLR